MHSNIHMHKNRYKKTHTNVDTYIHIHTNTHKEIDIPNTTRPLIVPVQKDMYYTLNSSYWMNEKSGLIFYYFHASLRRWWYSVYSTHESKLLPSEYWSHSKSIIAEASPAWSQCGNIIEFCSKFPGSFQNKAASEREMTCVASAASEITQIV